MSEEPDLLGEWLSQPSPTHVDTIQSAPAPRQNLTRQSSTTNWLLIAVCCLLAFVIGSRFQGCDSSPFPDDDKIVIDETGKFVLILEDKSEAGQARLTAGQKTALNSTMTQEQAESLGFAFRKLDAADDVSNMESIWQTLKGKAAEPPSMTAASDGRLTTGPLPDGVGEIKIALESIK